MFKSRITNQILVAAKIEALGCRYCTGWQQKAEGLQRKAAEEGSEKVTNSLKLRGGGKNLSGRVHCRNKVRGGSDNLSEGVQMCRDTALSDEWTKREYARSKT